MPLKDSFTQIRYHTAADPYHFTIDNRPLTDIKTNLDLLADTMDAGFTSLTLTASTSVVTPLVTTEGTGNLSLATSGGTQLRITHVATAVNNLSIEGSIATDAPKLRAVGTDPSISLFYIAKGTSGGHSFYTNSGGPSVEQFRVAHTGSAVNYLEATGAAALGRVQLIARGIDPNVGINLVAKGSGGVYVNTQAGTVTQFGVEDSGGATLDYIVAQGGTNNPFFTLRGSSSDCNMVLISKGTGSLRFSTGGTLGNEQLRITHTATAVNYVQVTGGAAGAGPVLRSAGGDPNPGLNISSQGSGVINFYTNGVNQLQLQVSHTASAVNFVQLTGGTVGNAARVTVAGNDPDIILDLLGKGTGSPRIQGTTATPAGGSTTARLLFGTTAGFGIYFGSGVPTVSAAQGSLYIRSDGSSTSTRLYVNTNGTTDWTNFTSAT